MPWNTSLYKNGAPFKKRQSCIWKCTHTSIQEATHTSIQEATHTFYQLPAIKLVASEERGMSGSGGGGGARLLATS